MSVEMHDSRFTDHMANERTFLAWVRTNIGIIAFGFVIEKFGLFIKQMGWFLGKSNSEVSPAAHGYSAALGIILICFGTVMNILAYMNFKNAEKKIEERSAYKPSQIMYALLIMTIILVGIFLVVYLIQSKF